MASNSEKNKLTMFGKGLKSESDKDTLLGSSDIDASTKEDLHSFMQQLAGVNTKGPKDEILGDMRDLLSSALLTGHKDVSKGMGS